MMRFKSILAAGLVAMAAFSSCSNDDNGVNVPGAEGEATTMGLSFTLPTSATRATEVGTANENAVSSITVYIFDGNGNAVTGNATTIDANTTNFDIVGTKYTLKDGKQIETTAGPRRIYIAANVQGFVGTPATEAALQTKKIAISDAAVATKFIMFSEVTAKNLAAQADGQSPEQNGAANKVVTSMERISAKVVVSKASDTFTQTFTSPAGFSIEYTVDQWGVGNDVTTAFAVKGDATTGDYRAFDASKFTNAASLIDDIDWATCATVYVGENTPVNGLIGEATYAMIRTIAKPSQVVSVDGGGNLVWSAPGTLTDLYVVITADKKAYFCDSETNAEAVLIKVGGNRYTYPGCYAYFTVLLNEKEAVAAKINRNEFIHVNVTGVASNGLFGGIPGSGSSGGEEPIDPTDPTDPDNPNPVDPEEPIEKKDAFLLFEVSVSPWLYTASNIDLQ